MIRIRKIYGYVKTFTCIGSGTKLLLPSWLLGLQHEERETQFFYADCSIWLDNVRCTPKTQLDSSRFKYQLCFFQKSPKILNPSLPGMTSFTSPVIFPIRDFYYDICDCHIIPARAPKTCTECVPLPVHLAEQF